MDSFRRARCKYCGKVIGQNQRNIFCNKKCYGSYLREQPAKRSNLPVRCRGSETLCWTCKNTNQDECSWFEKYAKPVAGWKAIERPINGVESYVVVECPNYEREEYYEDSNKRHTAK